LSAFEVLIIIQKKLGGEMMKVKLCILTAVLLLGAAPAFADTYSIEAFQFSLPQLADWVGENPVGDRADTIAQIGKEQTWYCFDITEIPDSEQIISATFTVRMQDYADDASTQRTLWYDPDDDWAFSWPHDPDHEVVKEVTELLSVINFNHDGWTWITTDVDINQHDWSKDLLDNYVTLMLTGPLNGYYAFGDAGFDGAVWTGLVGEGSPHTIINDTPTDAETTTGASSNWAYDHTQNPTDVNHLTDAQVSALHAAGDDDAIHDNVAGEIDAIAAVTPTLADKIIIEDQSDSWNKKETALGEIVLAGDVGGKLSNTVVSDNSHNHDAQYYTEAEVNALFGIGSANKRWAPASYCGVTDFAAVISVIGWNNVGAADAGYAFDVGLPLIIGGTHNMVITAWRIGAVALDGDDEITRIRCFGWTIANPPLQGQIGVTDNGDYNSPAQITYNIADTTIGGVYNRVMLYLEMNHATANQAIIVDVEFEYYYT